ncbi:hypothetical protein D3C81_1835170 [compost metagenome]
MSVLFNAVESASDISGPAFDFSKLLKINRRTPRATHAMSALPIQLAPDKKDTSFWIYSPNSEEIRKTVSRSSPFTESFDPSST